MIHVNPDYLWQNPIFFTGPEQDSQIHLVRDTGEFVNYTRAPYSRFSYVTGFTASLPFGNIHSSEIFIAGINDARISTERYIAVGGDRRVVAETVPRKVRPDLRPAFSDRQGGRFVPFAERLSRGLNGPCFKHIDGVVALLAQQNDNYAHWHMDVLSSIGLLQELKLDRKVTMLTADLKNYRRRSLEILQVDMTRVCEIPGENLVDQYISCDRLLVPSPITVNYGHIPLWQQRVYERIVNNIIMTNGNDPSLYPKRVYVDRSNDPKRKCLNESALIERLVQFGFVIFDPRKVSYEDEVLTFANAESIVGCMGAGLVNAIFARPGTGVVEIKPPQHHKTNLWKTCATLSGARHHSILIQDTGTTAGDTWIIPDIDAIVEEIRQMM